MSLSLSSRPLAGKSRRLGHTHLSPGVGPACLVAALWVLAACGGPPPPPDISYVDSAGVQVGTYAGEDRLLTVELSRDFGLGGEGDGPESFYELFPRFISISPDGLIGVLNRPRSEVSVFDASGTHLFGRGREGDGPGELAFPSALMLRTGGEVGVFDYRKRAIVYYGADGSVLDQTAMPVPFNGYMGMIPAPDGILLMSQTAPRGAGDVVRRVLYLSENDTVQLGPSATTPAAFVEYQSCGINLTLPPLFASEIRWSSNGRLTALATDTAYSVSVFDGQTLVRIIRRSIEPEAVTADIVARELGDGERWGGGGRECVVPPHEVISSRGHATHLPVVQAIAVSPEGAIWIERRAPGGGAVFVDIFSADGEYVGSAPQAELPFPAAFLPDGRIATIERDDFDIDRLAVYSVSLSQR